MQYLKLRLALTAAEAQVDGLRKEYDAYQKQIWSIETKSMTSNVSEGKMVRASCLLTAVPLANIISIYSLL